MNETKKFIFPTSHLLHFDIIDKLSKLYGDDEYVIHKKALWYQIFSIPLRTITVDLGDIHTDCRFHAAYPLPSGIREFYHFIYFLNKGG
jgi:hypothetical protein